MTSRINSKLTRRRLSRFVDCFTDQLLLGTGQFEYLKADNSDRGGESAEKFVHSLQLRVNSGADKQNRSPTFVLLARV